MRKGRKFVALLAAIVIARVNVPVFADWQPGDGHKMHYPQLPDETGSDVYSEYPWGLADNWMCSESGPVSDIHFWGSWLNDVIGETGDILVRVLDNDDTGDFDKPGSVLWENVFTEADYTAVLYADGYSQGWYDPRTGWYDENNHEQTWQYNIPLIPEPFYQEEGEMYWLMISMDFWDCQWGWKTSLDHYGDDAVFWQFSESGYWEQLHDPVSGESLDLAFVITPEPSTIFLLGLGALALLRKRRQ